MAAAGVRKADEGVGVEVVEEAVAGAVEIRALASGSERIDSSSLSSVPLSRLTDVKTGEVGEVASPGSEEGRFDFTAA